MSLRCIKLPKWKLKKTCKWIYAIVLLHKMNSPNSYFTKLPSIQNVYIATFHSLASVKLYCRNLISDKYYDVENLTYFVFHRKVVFGYLGNSDGTYNVNLPNWNDQLFDKYCILFRNNNNIHSHPFVHFFFSLGSQ